MTIEIGDTVYTPRFCTVRIEAMFDSPNQAQHAGYREPTYYDSPDYGILGKHLAPNHMVFAAVRKP